MDENDQGEKRWMMIRRHNFLEDLSHTDRAVTGELKLKIGVHKANSFDRRC
jgi:hypothetical protein